MALSLGRAYAKPYSNVGLRILTGMNRRYSPDLLPKDLDSRHPSDEPTDIFASIQRYVQDQDKRR